MSNGTLPDADRLRPADLASASAWLARHGLVDAKPTPVLATRLAARWRARIAASLLLAMFPIAVALTYLYSAGMLGSEPHWRTPLLIMTAVVSVLVAAQSLLDWWVRRVDRRIGATLLRRVAHPMRLGWRTVLGWPRTAFAVATFAGAVLLAIGALTVADSIGLYAVAILFIALCGVAVSIVVQLRHLLAHPAVADDEVTLEADVIMRVEDAREVAGPTAVWCLPVMLFDTAPGWLLVAWLAFVVLGAITLWQITVRTASSGTVARHAMSGR